MGEMQKTKIKIMISYQRQSMLNQDVTGHHRVVLSQSLWL